MFILPFQILQQITLKSGIPTELIEFNLGRKNYFPS